MRAPVLIGLALTLAGCDMMPDRVDTPPIPAQLTGAAGVLTPTGTSIVTVRSFYNTAADRVWIEDRAGAACTLESNQQRVAFTTPARVALATFGVPPATSNMVLTCTYQGETVHRAEVCFGSYFNCTFADDMSVIFNLPD